MDCGGRRGRWAGRHPGDVSAELWEVLAAGWASPRQRGRDLGGSLNLNLLVSRGDERLVVRCTGPRSEEDHHANRPAPAEARGQVTYWRAMKRAFMYK